VNDIVRKPESGGLGCEDSLGITSRPGVGLKAIQLSRGSLERIQVYFEFEFGPLNQLSGFHVEEVGVGCRS